MKLILLLIGVLAVISCDTNSVVPPEPPPLLSSSSSGYPPLSEGQSGVFVGGTTRYWDACKPSCGWLKNAGSQPVARSCSVTGATLFDLRVTSACEILSQEESEESIEHSSFTCMDQSPWAINDSLAYGFAATHAGRNDCGKCFQLQFTNTAIAGKTMIVIVSNIGNDVDDGKFDIMIPGGGVGRFDAFTYQLTQNGIEPNLGQKLGGFRTACGPDKDCIRNMCEHNFGTAGLADLKQGCDWYLDWFEFVNNPQILYKEVICPADLLDRYGWVREL